MNDSPCSKQECYVLFEHGLNLKTLKLGPEFMSMSLYEKNCGPD